MNLRAPRRLILLALVAPTVAVLPMTEPASAVRPDSPASAYAVSEWSSESSAVLPDQPYAAVHVSHFATYGITLTGEVVSAVHNHMSGSLVAPAFDRPIRDVVASESFGLALDDLGHVHTWGSAPTIPAADLAESYRDLAAGSTHAIGVTSEGELRFWGSAPWGEFGFAASDLEGQEIVSVDTGSSASVALTAEGEVISAGGAVTTEWSADFAFPADRADERVVAIDVGAGFALALTDAGEVIAWGTNNWGERDVPSFPAGRRAVAVSAGTSMAGAVLDDGTVVDWGQRDRTQLPPVVPGVGAVDLDLENYRAVVVYPTTPTTGAPTITGTPQHGETLSASSDIFATDPDEVHYEWHAHDEYGDVRIVGTDSPTYAPSVDDAEAGARISVTVTGRTAGLADSRMLSPLTGSVARGTFTSAPSVSLTGDARVGGTLTAQATDSAPASVEREWAWFTVADTTDTGEDAPREVTPIEGADGPNLALTPALADATVFARLTVARPGYESASGESSDVAVGRGLLSEPTITVTGTFQVGETLTATSLAVVPTPDRVDWTWYRDTGQSAAEHLADGPTLRLTPELVDARVFVTAIASKDGYDLSPAETEPVVVLPGLLSTPTVSVTGRPRIGQVLTASATTDPTATGTSYQWLRGGVPIAGAAARTYRPVAADLGKRLSVRVISNAPGYTAATGTSAATAAVTLGSVRLKVAVPGKVVVGKKATITIRGLAGGERFTVTMAGKRLTGRASGAGVGKVTLKVTGKPGKRAVKVVGSVADRTGTATLRVVRRR